MPKPQFDFREETTANTPQFDFRETGTPTTPKFDFGEQEAKQPTVAEDYSDIVSGIEPSFAEKALEKVEGFERGLSGATDTLSSFIGTKQVTEELGNLVTGEEVDKSRLAGGAASSALWFMPQTLLAKGVKEIPILQKLFASTEKIAPKTTRLLGKGLQSAEFGAEIGASQAAKEGEDVSQGALTGAIAAPVTQGSFNIMGKVFNKIPLSISKILLRVPKAQTKMDLAKGKTPITEKFLDKIKVGTYKSLYENSNKAIDEIEIELSKKLASSKAPISTKIAINNTAQSEVAQNALMTTDDIIKLVQSKVPQSRKFLAQSTLSPTETNELRKIVDRTLGDKAWLSSATPHDTTILKKFANELRETVKATVPESVAIFSDYADEVVINKALQNQTALREKGTIPLSRIFQVMGGGMLGAGVGQVGGSGWQAGAIAGAALSSPVGMTSSAVLLRELVKAGVKVTPVIEQAIIRATSSGDSQQTEEVQ